MKRILVCNDDGIHAVGLRVARKLLEPYGELFVVVPDREMSGASHALTLNHPLRLEPVDERVYVVNGTPTDCINLALNQVLDQPPDLVFSGINLGSNIGLDVSYSGTVAAALEGALQGIPSIAVSIEAAGDLRRTGVADAVDRVVEAMLGDGRPGNLLNVNIPAGEIRGVRPAVQGDAGFRSEIIEKADPRGKSYYWIGGQHAHESEARAHSDIALLRAGFVAVTPLTLDLTDHATYQKMCGDWQP